tara:strand:+ start:1049 stop:1930 length:882 start_codon:yes stop_codon:yes gene_type:complete
MAHVLKSNFRTAGDATRFGGQLPTFYLDPSNFTGDALPIASGGTGATSISAARTSLDVHSKAEITTLISNAQFGSITSLIKDNSSISVDTSQIQLKISNGIISTITNSLFDISTNVSIAGTLNVTGNINGVANVHTKANTAFGWGDHSQAGYFTGSTTIQEMANITISSIADGQILRYNAGTQVWENKPFDLSAFNISQLIDVDTVNNAPSIGDVLKWNGTNWVPDTDKTVLVQNINDLLDVDTVSQAAVANDLLMYTGASWQPKNIAEISITNLSLTTLSATDFNIDFGVVT